MRQALHMVLKGCNRCHGDLLLDKEASGAGDILVYECLQCGRTTRLMLEPEHHVHTAEHGHTRVAA